MKKYMKLKIVMVIIFIFAILSSFIYYFDEIILPSVLAICDGEMRARAVQVMNKSILEKYVNEFDYEDIIKFQKDENGNIVLVQADTLKMNKIANEVSLEIQEELNNLSYQDVKIPTGYITKNNILANFGPKITAKMQPIGHVETKYSSDFETAGINQVRHKIYVEVKTNIKVILPMANEDVQVATQVPIAETIIVGKIPETSIQMDMNKQ
ncbi:sporulation protein YunB [Clostridium senegalense]|uniref:sporulation protein YunB n=1 Tax=Clostridium senegalense TaxID=1465809 RepID=UPI000287E7F6|nr:sporulation protein YunB [Clostridium senegalense]